MKQLRLADLPVADRLRLSFEATFDPQAPLERELEPLVHALEMHAGEWMPHVIKGKRQHHYSRATLWKALEERRDEHSTAIGLHRTEWPALDMSLELWFPPLPLKLSIWVAVQPLSFFEGEDRCREFVDMVCAWASHYPVTHAVANSLAEDQLAEADSIEPGDAASRSEAGDTISEVCWLNVFGSKLVERVGRERVLSTPAHRVEELPDGAVLVVTWPTAADFASEEAREAQARAWVHLRPDLEYATVLRTLRERSAALTSVEPRFHPDVAALLSRVVERVPLSQRQRQIAEFNAYQPPEPDEWLPADGALPSDVSDPMAERAQYSLLAEQMVALLHTHVPSVFEQTPESLTDADAWFWSENFPETFERHAIDTRAVPAVGAYLGQVLVRRLGGEWIPRQKLEEVQVRVGERVWLPFVRAQRYMRSRQSLLDCSLTQLYREAERHLGERRR
jgi:hypothetical protein